MNGVRMGTGPAALTAAFAAEGEWVTRFVIDGVAVGGAYPAGDDPRLDLFCAEFPEARSVLELGSLEGGHTVELARRLDAAVVGVEARRENLRRARFVQRFLGVPGISFVEADVARTPLERFGRFDVVFCVGLLYHLSEPWKLLDQVADVAPAMFIWTHYAADDDPEIVTVSGCRGRWYSEHGLDDPLSGLRRRSFWLTRGEIVERLRRNGFAVRSLHDDPINHGGAGPCITLVARRNPARSA